MENGRSWWAEWRGRNGKVKRSLVRSDGGGRWRVECVWASGVAFWFEVVFILVVIFLLILGLLIGIGVQKVFLLL